MSALGTQERPLRVAIVGSGPSGFYAAGDLLKQNLNIKVDMFDKLPSPYGLVRYGVAPDHPKIKNVTKVFEKTASHPQFSFFGHVNVGKDISVLELNQFYDAVIYTYGAETDRRLEINGEDLPGSYTATEFVAWYNGHPEFQDRHFDFSKEEAVIIGNGNVAMDVARILCKTTDELKTTDITQNALAALAESKVREVHLYGRRGPVQAAFTSAEIREMGELADCYPVVYAADLELNESSAKELEDKANAVRKKNYDILKEFASVKPDGRKRKFVLHFNLSPVELMGNGRLEKAKFEINALSGEPNRQKAHPTGRFEEIGCGMFFRSVGYTGVAMEGLPFFAPRGVIPNTFGRVTGPEGVMTGWYVAGWIKRGANGVIGTNKPDAEETVGSLLRDLGRLNPCPVPDSQAMLNVLKGRGIRVVTFDDWKKIDAAEVQRGAKTGKPREKFIEIHGMLAAL